MTMAAIILNRLCIHPGMIINTVLEVTLAELTHLVALTHCRVHDRKSCVSDI
jgi:hypothetical protein